MAADRPKILAISLHHQLWFDDMYQVLLALIKSKAEFLRAEDEDSAARLLSEQPGATAVLITDEALSLKENKHVWEAVLRYIRRGGTAVVMGLFPSFVKPADINPFFAQAGLQWGVSSYTRTTVYLNDRTTVYLNHNVVEEGLAAKLFPEYSQKAVFITNVAPEDAWYTAGEGSMTDSVPGECPVAFARVGEGKLGYVGDITAEQQSDHVILAMCGLL